MNIKIKYKVALVTGGARGIREEVVRWVPATSTLFIKL